MRRGTDRQKETHTHTYIMTYLGYALLCCFGLLDVLVEQGQRAQDLTEGVCVYGR